MKSQDFNETELLHSNLLIEHLPGKIPIFYIGNTLDLSKYLEKTLYLNRWVQLLQGLLQFSNFTT